MRLIIRTLQAFIVFGQLILLRPGDTSCVHFLLLFHRRVFLQFHMTVETSSGMHFLANSRYSHLE